MLKSLLTATAFAALAVAAAGPSFAASELVSIQGAKAFDAQKLRQIIVEPIPGKGPVKTSVQELVVAPGGTPSQSADAGSEPPKTVIKELVVAPGGTPSQSADAGSEPPKALPIIKTPEGTPSADAGADDAQPADPVEAADANPPQEPAAIAAPADDTSGAADPVASAGDDQPDEAAPPAAKPAPTGINSPSDLYATLTGRGYGVEVLRRDYNGNLVFLVTVPGRANDAYLLVVDRQYGKVLVRREINLAAYGYGKVEVYHAPAYSQSYRDDRSDEAETGYQPTFHAGDYRYGRIELRPAPAYSQSYGEAETGYRRTTHAGY
jgi:hypothetical protein